MAITEYSPRVFLTRDRVLEGLKISHTRGDSNTIDLAGYRLNLGEAVLVFGTLGPSAIHNGVLTSSEGLLRINATFDSKHLMGLRSVISDNGKQRVGVDLVRDDGATSGHKGIEQGGNQFNIFTGDFNMRGYVRINLSKNEGAIAISGNLNITNGGAVRILRNEQVNNKSRVLLKSGVNEAYYIQLHGYHQADITETFHLLTIDARNVLDFGGGDNEGRRHGIRKLFLDDLGILDGGHLIIAGWEDQRDFLLVRKGSKHLRDAFKKLHFIGYQYRIHLVDYNKDYWEISNAPELAVYGAIIGAYWLWSEGGSG